MPPHADASSAFFFNSAPIAGLKSLPTHLGLLDLNPQAFALHMVAMYQHVVDVCVHAPLEGASSFHEMDAVLSEKMALLLKLRRHAWIDPFWHQC